MEFLVDGQKVLIDDEDWPLVQGYNWHIRKDGYVVAMFGPNGNRHEIRLNRLVMEVCLRDSRVVDHRHHILLDNRKSELRVCSRHQNNMNAELHVKNKCGCAGVYWNIALSKWHVQIMDRGKRIHLGYFCSFESAVGVRKQAEVKYFGEFRYMEAA